MNALKALVAVLGAALTAASGLALSGNVQTVITIALAALTALGVYLAPNKPAVAAR